MSLSTQAPASVRPVPATRRIDTASRNSEVLELLPAAVYTIDRAGRITFFNEGRPLGSSPGANDPPADIEHEILVKLGESQLGRGPSWVKSCTIGREGYTHAQAVFGAKSSPVRHERTDQH
jgi:hypothetical protein